MARELANLFSGGISVAKAVDIAAKMADSAQNDPRGAGDSLYLNFSGKRGIYTIGYPESRNVQPDEDWLVNITSFEDGWVCWKGGKPAAARMSNIFSGVPVQTPDFDEFGPFDDRRGEGWFQAKALVLKSLDTMEQGYFRVNSKSGVSAIAGLQRSISEQIAAGGASWPIVRLDVEEFEAQGYQNFKPEFKVSGWLNDDHIKELADDPENFDFSAVLDNGEAPVKQEAPQSRRRRIAR